MNKLRVGAVFALCFLTSCNFLDMLRILAVDFKFEKLDVSTLAYESDPILAAVDLLDFDNKARKKYGVDVVFRIQANNTNSYKAAFQGASAFLRIQDTAMSASAAEAWIPAFSVGARKDTTLDIVFPLRMHQPIFSQEVWTKIVQGGDIPYRLNAEMFFKLVDLDSTLPLGSSTIRLQLAKGAVDARSTSSKLVDWLLEYVRLIL